MERVRFWVLINIDRPRGAARGAAAGAVSYLLFLRFEILSIFVQFPPIALFFA